MDADLDLLCIAVYCTADDLLPEPPGNARRMVTDAEVVTLCVAQAIMGIPSDRRFLKVARKHLGHLFPEIPSQSGVFQASPPLGGHDRVADQRVREPEPRLHGRSAVDRLDPGRVRRAAARPSNAPRSPTPPTTAGAPPTPATSGASGCTPSSPPTAPRERWRSPRPNATNARSGSNCSAAANAQAVRRCSATRATPAATSPAQSATLDATIVRPRRKDEPGQGPHLAPIRQRIESIFWTCKDLLTLERHGARTLAGIKERILQRFLCLAACIALNHQLGRPSRALADYVA